MRLHQLSINPVWLPVLLAQGWWVRRMTPRLPDAAGPYDGLLTGAGAAFDLIVLGESTVAGIGASAHAEALTGQIAQSFQHQTGRAVRWYAVGQSGATVRVALNELVPKIPVRRANALVLVFGVNDALKLRSAAEWKNDLRQLVAALRARLGPVPVLCAAAPPLQEFPAFPKRLGNFLGTRARLLNGATAALADELENFVYAPMVGGLSAEDFCADRFHPSVSGYAAWGSHLAKYLTVQSVGEPGKITLQT